MDAIYPILKYAQEVTFDALPSSTVTITKRFILDTLATMAAGTRAPGCREVVEQLREWGGRRQSTIAGGGPRLPAPSAALANAMMSHALDFDDSHEAADVHANAVVLPATLAVAEVVGGVTGRDVIAAVAVGVDVACRMGLAIRRYRGWHPTATCGIFGATLAAGRVMGLRGSTLHHAAGIAYSLASGNFQAIPDGALTKRLQPGFAARAAVEAVMLARGGITGAKDILEGQFGFYPLYEAGEYDPAPLKEDLGRRFEGEALSMKPYPSCRLCHSAIDAVLALSAEEEISPADVQTVEVEMPKEAHDYVGGLFRAGDAPQVSAQFNTAYNVAVALLHKAVRLEHSTDDATRDPRILELADRVATTTNNDPYKFGPVTVTITLRSGKVRSRRVTIMKGHPDSPMTDAERRQKLESCVAYAGWPSSRGAQLAEWVERLDRAQNPVPNLRKTLS